MHSSNVILLECSAEMISISVNLFPLRIFFLDFLPHLNHINDLT